MARRLGGLNEPLVFSDGMPYLLAREKTSDPHHAFDTESQRLVCGWSGQYTMYDQMAFESAHPYACSSCSALTVLEETGVLPASSLVPGETVAIQDGSGEQLCSVAVRQHQLVDLGYADRPFNRRRLIGHRMHLDVSDPATEAAVKAGLQLGARVQISASVPFPPLAVVNVQDPATIIVDGRPVKRCDVLFRPA